jgi:hypothetical protein
MSIIRIVINMDQEEHYRNIGWTRELDFCIKCPNCETENYFITILLINVIRVDSDLNRRMNEGRTT